MGLYQALQRTAENERLRAAFLIVVMGLLPIVLYSFTLKLPLFGDDFILFAQVSGNSYRSTPDKFSIYNIVEPQVTRDSPQTVPWWTSHKAKVRFLRPLGSLSFKLDYLIWGKNPFGYHLTSVLIYSLSCILLFLIGRLLFKRDGIAFFGALIFTNHFIPSFVIPWVADRVCLLSLLFGLSGLYFHIRFRQKGSKWWGVLAWLGFLLSILTKEGGAIFIAVYFLYDFFVWRKDDADKWPGIIRIAPYYLLLCLPLGVFIVYFIISGYGVVGYYDILNEPWPVYRKAAYLLLNILLYLTTLLYVHIPIYKDVDALLFLRLFATLAIAIFLLYPAYKKRLLKEGVYAFLTLWLLVSLVPVFHLYPQNRQLYFSIAPFGLFISLYLFSIDTLKGFGKYSRAISSIIAIYFVVVLITGVMIKRSNIERFFSAQTAIVKETVPQLNRFHPPLNVFFINYDPWMNSMFIQYAFDFYIGKGQVRVFALTITQDVPTVSVLGEHSLLVTTRSEPFLDSMAERYPMTEPLNREGLTVSNNLFSSTMKKVEDGHIKAIQFDFVPRLDDECMRFFFVRDRKVYPISFSPGLHGQLIF